MSDVSEAYQRAASCLAEQDIDTHSAALRELETLAHADPEKRQPVADVVCHYLRGAVVQPVDNTADVRAKAVALLAALARPQPVAGEVPADTAGDDGCGVGSGDRLVIDLSGAVLPDVDFSGCDFDRALFVDVHFRGSCVFDGAHFHADAIFARAVFEDEASFTDVRFHLDAHFGLARFHGPASFAGARFHWMAWFGRGEESVSDDDPRFDELDEDGHPLTDRPDPFGTPIPWREPNEADPCWPNAVLMEDYQSWYEGGDGACFRDRVTFSAARFHKEAWFWKARFGAGAVFNDAWFGDRVHLDQPTVDLTDTTADSVSEEGADAGESFSPQEWPFGWVPRPGDDGPARLVTDQSVAPYTHQLADTDPAVQLSGLYILEGLGQARTDLRANIIGVLCGFLRTPLAFDVSDEAVLDAQQAAELKTRRTAQQILTSHLRPYEPGAAYPSTQREQFWEGVRLSLSGATLIDFDLSDCQFDHADFMGTQFHGTTNLERSAFKVNFSLPGGGGYTTFHGECRYTDAALVDGWAYRKSADEALQRVLSRSSKAATA